MNMHDEEPSVDFTITLDSESDSVWFLLKNYDHQTVLADTVIKSFPLIIKNKMLLHSYKYGRISGFPILGKTILSVSNSIEHKIDSASFGPTSDTIQFDFRALNIRIKK